MYRIMLVDDEENILNALTRALRNKEWQLESYLTPMEALKRAQTVNFDLFISDYRMPDMDGVTFLSQVKDIRPESMRIILSGYADLNALTGAINQAEIYRFLTKPWQNYELLITVHQALEHHDILLENRMLADQVRQQNEELNKRKELLDEFQELHPELNKVNWAEDGSIILDEFTK